MANIPFLNNAYFAGTVGIGTESPLKKLSISGGDVAVNNGNSFIVGAAITGNTQIGELGADAGQLQLLTESTRDIKFGSTTYGNIMFLEGSNGNVGIGETSPDRMLHVNSGTNNANTIFESTDTAVTVRFKDLTGSAQLECRNDFRFLNNAGADQRMVISAAGAIKFNNYGAGTLVTDASGNITVSSGGGAGGPFLPLAGGTMTGNINFNDDVYARFGNGNDLDIGHDASNSRITHNGVGNLIIQNTEDNSDIIFQSDDGSGGVATYFKVDPASQATTFLKRIYLPDDVKAQFGNSSDLKIYHDGSNSYIEDTGSGDLILTSNASSVQINKSTGVNLAKFIVDGSVELYFNSSKKFETTSAGINITGGWVTNGVSVATANVEHTDNTKSLFGNGNDLQIYHDGNNSYIQDVGSGDLRITSSGASVAIQKGLAENMARFLTDGAVELYYDNSKKFETTSTGVNIFDTLKLGTTGTAAGKLITADSMVFQIDSDNSGTGSSYRFRTNGTADDGIELMRIQEDGKVGIGELSPDAKLHIHQTGSGTVTTIITEDDARKLFIGRDSIKCTNLSNTATALFIQQDGGLSQTGGDLTVLGNVGLTGAGDPIFDIFRDSGANHSIRLHSEGVSWIDNNNNFGIGTNTPSAKLEIKGDGASTGTFSFKTFDSNNNETFFIEDGGRVGVRYSPFSVGIPSTTAVATNAIFQVEEAGSLTVLDGGNVGIGTTAPQRNLTVFASSGNAVFQLANATSGVGSSDGFLVFTNGVDVGLENKENGYLSFATNASEKMRILQDGKVGIGTDSPSTTLDVRTDTGVLIKGKTGSANAKISFLPASGGRQYDLGNVGADFRIFDASANVTRMYFDNDRNTGINTITPRARLEVFREAGVSSTPQLTLGTGESGSEAFSLSTDTVSAGDFCIIKGATNSAANVRLRITPAGNVLIGTNVEQNAKLFVSDANDRGFATAQFRIEGNGYTVAQFMDTSEFTIQQNSNGRNIRIMSKSNGVRLTPNATAWTSASDEILKENIKPLNNVLDKIKDYRCVEYNFKNDKDKKIGFIAQDWEKDFNAIVSKDKKGILSMKYTETIPVLLKAIQELKAEIELLKAK